MRNPKYKFLILVAEAKTSTTTTTASLQVSAPTHGYISPKTGVEMTSSLYFISDYYKIEKSYKVSWEGQDDMYLYVYDAGKNYLKYYNGDEGEVQMTAGQYIRVCAVKTSVILAETITTITYTEASYKEVHPIYKELSIEASKDTNQIFFRKTLSGKLKFVKDEYDWIDGQKFDFVFKVYVKQSLDGGKTYTDLIQGKFTKTDGTWNAVDKCLEVSLSEMDEYDDIVNGLDKEFDLIKLAPEIEKVYINRDSALQLYVLGSSVLGYYHNNMYWEADCNEVDDEDEMTDTYHFGKAGVFCACQYSYISAGKTYTGKFWGKVADDGAWHQLTQTGNTNLDGWYRGGDVMLLTKGTYTTPQNAYDNKAWVKYGNTNVYSIFDKFTLYGRILFAKSVSGASAIPSEDIVDDNRDYRYCAPFSSVGSNIVISLNRSASATEWGLVSDTEYFDKPSGDGVYYPIAQSSWVSYSLWLNAVGMSSKMNDYRYKWTLRHAYPLWSVISVLVGQLTDDVTHEGTTEYSKVLYGNYGDTNPYTEESNMRLYLTPKSNLIHGDYTTPAMTCKTTLGTIFDALREMFCIYWYIEDGKLKLEHESFFRRGKSYTGEMGVCLDLTTMLRKRDGKPWAYAQGEYSYDKSDMAEKYEYAWMDEVSDAFETDGVTILSNYVTKGQVEDTNVSDITTDIDYIQLCPSEVSEDGMVLMGCVMSGSNSYPSIAYATYDVNGLTSSVQNGYLSWSQLVSTWHTWSMPATRIKFEDETITLEHTTQRKEQTIKFPYTKAFDDNKLLTTILGNASIAKYSLSLQSLIISATLAYDTEQ